MTEFAVETSADTPEEREIVTTNRGGRVVLWRGHVDATVDVEQAMRQAYSLGRRAEAAIRAAAFKGLSSGSPLA